MVIFGASGDLTRRKLIPALYNLALEQWLPAGFSVVGFARRADSDDVFRQHMHEAVDAFSRRRPVQPAVWESFAQGLFYIPADFEDPGGYETLRDALNRIDETRGTQGNRVFYLATPPSFYADIVRQLSRVGLNQGGRRPGAARSGWARLIVEKPFGRDLASAQALNRAILEVFREDQIYRIDHYLGKETVQNLLVFRFANGIFEPVWNRRYVDHVQITVAESVGIEGRAGYYEEAGALRDMVQSHMLQVLSLVAMEPPIAFDADDVRDEKVKVLRALRPLAGDEAIRCTARGQYGRGWVGGAEVPGYREEPGVAPDSVTETFVALKLFVDNWRWEGVPFYLRTGKRLAKRSTEIAVQFRSAPHMLFRSAEGGPLEPNVLAMHIQPDEGMSLRFSAKVPGASMEIRPVHMNFLYGASFGTASPDAYERLLLDCMLGDSTLFTRRDEVEAEWAFITRILEGWQQAPRPAFPNYEAGTWGPAAADDLMQGDGRRWRRL
jgi:glucose-6-phosphate 1-dehydrogenase